MLAAELGGGLARCEVRWHTAPGGLQSAADARNSNACPSTQAPSPAHPCPPCCCGGGAGRGDVPPPVHSVAAAQAARVAATPDEHPRVFHRDGSAGRRGGHPSAGSVRARHAACSRHALGPSATGLAAAPAAHSAAAAGDHRFPSGRQHQGSSPCSACTACQPAGCAAAFLTRCRAQRQPPATHAPPLLQARAQPRRGGARRCADAPQERRHPGSALV